MTARVVAWFSCGTPSAVAAKLAVAQYGATHEVVIARTAIPSEHPDNDRFADDVAAWLGRPVLSLRSDRYDDIWDVWEKRRYLAGPKGALCTTEMKKMVRHAYQRPDDIQVFGYAIDANDVARAKRFREQNFEVDLRTPLIDAGLSKADCHALIRRAGIELPAMYRLGYLNNNCIGCVKGGAGYWNKIRVDFPAVFERMAALQRRLSATTLQVGGKRIYLDELKPGVGRYKAEPDIECSLLCAGAA